MKKIKTSSLFLLMTLMFSANAKAESDWQLSTSVYKTVASDSESIVQSGAGLQVSLHRKSLFLYLSKDVNQVRFSGQSGPDVNLWSAGIGMQHRIGKHLFISLDVGWYEPKFKEMRYHSRAYSWGLLYFGGVK